MASRKSSTRVQKHSSGITSVLASAAYEWLLIFLLFLEAFFSYLVTRFAQFCELQTPCLLCSRLDHIFGSEKPGFYWDLICCEHKLEISSLVYCRTHEKLNDIRGVCKGCVPSFSTMNITNYETDKFAVGFIEYSVDDKRNICLKMPTTTDGEEFVSCSLLNDPSVGSLGPRQCSCCSQLLRVVIDDAQTSQKSVETESMGAVTTQVHVSRSSSVGPGHLHHQVSLKKRRERSSVSAPMSYLGNTGFDPLSHVGYTELKVTSDSESEVPISDDDDGVSLAREASDVRVDFVADFFKPELRTVTPETLPETLSSDSVIEKLIHQAPVSEPSISVPVEQIHVSEPHGVSSAASVFDVGHGLEGFNWHKSKERGNPSGMTSELIPSCGVSSAVSEVIIPEEPYSSTNAEKHVVEISREEMIGDTEHASIIERKEVFKSVETSTESDCKPDMALNEATSSVSDCLDLNDAYKLAVGNKGNHLLIMSKDFAGGHEDLKLLLSQISAARGFELSWNDMVPSPRVQQTVEDVKPIEASSSIEMQVLKKNLSMERNQSGVESLDGSLIGVAEGENGIDQLKQQIELDRKSMRALYKELEEERNAAAIAANQAMAMINRLQEEKAAMQMEALQYQRMMEEQAEYDQEALQKLNDVLIEKEKEVQDLEAQLEDYRKGIWNDSSMGRGTAAVSHNSHSDGNCHAKYSNVPCDHEKTDRVCGDCKGNELDIMRDTLLDFENEKLYLSKCLNELQKKVHTFYDNGDYVDLSGVNRNTESFPDVNCKDTKKIISNEENVQNSVAIDAVDNAGCSQEKGSRGVDTEWHEEMKLNGTLLRDDTECLDRRGMTQGNNLTDLDRQFDLAPTKSDLVAIVKEFSNMSERLTALEVEWNVLEHSINSLQNGNEGLQFIQEIASNLRELRQIGVRSGEKAVA